MFVRCLVIACLVASGAAYADGVKSVTCSRNYTRNSEPAPHTLTLKRATGKGYTLTVDGQHFTVSDLARGYFDADEVGAEGLKGGFEFEPGEPGKVFLIESPMEHGLNLNRLRVEVAGGQLDIDGHDCKVKH